MKKVIPITIFILCFASVCMAESGFIANIRHKIIQNTDGGYTIILTGSKRSLMPITPEGFFPKTGIYYQITLRGKGKDWKYRNQPGYYYKFPEDIDTTSATWDLGYAWVDRDRRTIFLNFYWVDAPNSLNESEISGAYKIEKGSE